MPKLPAISSIRKTIASVVAAGLTFWQIVQASPSGPITANEYRLGGLLLAGALGVYAVTNEK